MDATSFTDCTNPLSKFCSRRSFVKLAAAGALAAPLSRLGSPGAVARVPPPDQEASMSGMKSVLARLISRSISHSSERR